ncbi:MAG: hypothetical protein J2P48_24595 [Alphaproteobacteria bacterium]|nr:hypothetical protein [Alphaproteobacteria bacterium]
MFSRRPPISPPHEERERITRARRAAEALFKANRPISDPPAPEPSTRNAQSARQPRVLRALSKTPARPDRDAPVNSGRRPLPEIPASQFARIRGWVKYGMTAGQVAALYGVAVDVIERIILLD